MAVARAGPGAPGWEWQNRVRLARVPDGRVALSGGSTAVAPRGGGLALSVVMRTDMPIGRERPPWRSVDGTTQQRLPIHPQCCVSQSMQFREQERHGGRSLPNRVAAELPDRASLPGGLLAF
jgi:hypothetical protein